MNNEPSVAGPLQVEQAKSNPDLTGKNSKCKKFGVYSLKAFFWIIKSIPEPYEKFMNFVHPTTCKDQLREHKHHSSFK